MSEPIETTYFNWLCAKVMYDEPGRSTDLLKVLHETEFVWRLPGDANRADDGKDLRNAFYRETRLSEDPDWSALGCSVLEMMLAFAARAEFETGTPEKEWFWIMLRNLKLDEYRHVTLSDVPEIESILHTFVWRTYNQWGDGGLWPIITPKRDQRDVEIWYQFCEFLDDRGLL